MKKQLLILLAVFAVSSQANALFEIRAGYGITTPDEDNVSLNTFDGFNLDAIVEIPMVPVGLGLRYENFGSSLTDGSTGDVDYTRTSLLVNYRFIDLFFYFGAIATIGLVNDLSASGTIPVVGSFNETWTGTNYSLGLEGGVSLGLFMVGAEAGYLMGELEADGNSSDFDTSALYGKIIVGVGF